MLNFEYTVYQWQRSQLQGPLKKMLEILGDFSFLILTI
jgi:hypothetical protein